MRRVDEMIYRIGSKILFLLRIVKAIGPAKTLKFFVSPPGALVLIKIAGIDLWVRKGTPDMEVAISTFTGEFEVLRFVLPRHFDGLIVDAGGYIGTAAIALHQMFPEATVVSIEPSHDNLEILRKNVEAFPKIEIVHGALVENSLDKVVLLDPGEQEWGFTTAPGHAGSSKGKILDEVPALTLQSLVEKWGKIGIVKLDIEGGELEILSAAPEALKASSAVFVELHERYLPGCQDAFWAFAADRIVINDAGEKFLAISRELAL